MTPAGKAYLMRQLGAAGWLLGLCVTVGIASTITADVYAENGDIGVYVGPVGFERAAGQWPTVWQCGGDDLPSTPNCPALQRPAIHARPLREMSVTFDRADSTWVVRLPDHTVLTCVDGTDATMWHGPWTVRCANGEVTTWTAPDDAGADVYVSK